MTEDTDIHYHRLTVMNKYQNLMKIYLVNEPLLQTYEYGRVPPVGVIFIDPELSSAQ